MEKFLIGLYFNREEFIPYNTHGNHANACNALGNLNNSVNFKLTDVIKTTVNIISELMLKVFKNLNNPILKIEIAEIVYIKKEYLLKSLNKKEIK